ncbi:sodium:solute symporter, partial [termite gut metagenome]
LNLLPVGVKGFVTVGFIAALVTSLAAHFNSSATLFTIDFYKQYKPNADEAKLVWIGRMATIAVVILGLVWIPIMRGLGNVLYEYLQEVQSLIAPAIAAVFVMGVFSKHITPKAGEWGLLAGFFIGMFRLVMMVLKPESMQWFLDVNWLIFCIFLFVFTMLLMVVISFFTAKASDEKLQGITYFSRSTAQKAETRAGWSYWDVITSAGVVAVCILFYIYFW